MATCQYCDQKKEGERCANCGATEAKAQDGQRERWHNPYLLHGYIVWECSDWLGDRFSWHFYLGDTLIETITLTRSAYRQFVPEHSDGTEFIWSLFELAQGKEEVLRIQQQNTREPAVFEIRHVKSDEKLALESMALEDVARAAALSMRR